jgi:uncharacterized protein (TIGR02117 family)
MPTGARFKRWAWLAVVLALITATFFPSPGDRRLFPARPGDPVVTVYVIDNGFHTNIAVPTEAIHAHGGLAGQALAQIKAEPWTQIGWGDARFYIESGASAARVLDGGRALFGPHNRSAVMFEPLAKPPPQLWSQGVASLTLSRAGLERMLARVDAALAPRDGKVVVLPAQGWGEARFFESGEAFSLMHLCNHWTASLLHAAGLPTRPVLDTLSAGVMADVRAAKRDSAKLDSGPQAR